MWNDADDKILDVVDCYEKREETKVPFLCPICNNVQAHIYMHRWKEESQKGGLWIWCSNCQAFAHTTYNLPQWWVNCEDIDFEQLTAVPGYLEMNKKIVDEHASKMLKNN